VKEEEKEKESFKDTNTENV